MKAKFMNFVDRLSRHEMSAIMGGYGGGTNGGGSCECLQGDDDGTCKTTHSGRNTGICDCTSDRPPYTYGLNSDDCR